MTSLAGLLFCERGERVGFGISRWLGESEELAGEAVRLGEGVAIFRRYRVSIVAMKSVASLGSVLRPRKLVSHSRRTASALIQALLLAISCLRSAFCSSVMGPLAAPFCGRFLKPWGFGSSR